MRTLEFERVVPQHQQRTKGKMGQSGQCILCRFLGLPGIAQTTKKKLLTWLSTNRRVQPFFHVSKGASIEWNTSPHTFSCKQSHSPVPPFIPTKYLNWSSYRKETKHFACMQGDKQTAPSRHS